MAESPNEETPREEFWHLLGEPAGRAQALCRPLGLVCAPLPAGLRFTGEGNCATGWRPSGTQAMFQTWEGLSRTVLPCG